MSVVMAAFRAHQLPLRNAYFDRFPPPPDERTPLTVPRLLQRMAELERATQFRDDQNRRAQGAAIQQANNAYRPASAYVVQQAPLPLAPTTVGPPPAAAFVVQPSGPPAEEWTPDKARAVYVNAFERKEEEAFGRSKGSPVPYENEIMSVYIVTADLNKEHMEPQDDNQIDQVLNAMRLIVAQARMSCPGFDRQLAQLLRNKERSVEMSRQRLSYGSAGIVANRDICAASVPSRAVASPPLLLQVIAPPPAPSDRAPRGGSDAFTPRRLRLISPSHSSPVSPCPKWSFLARSCMFTRLFSYASLCFMGTTQPNLGGGCSITV